MSSRPSAPSIAPSQGWSWSSLAGAALPLVVIGAVLVLLVPMPPALMDVLLAANITLSVLVLLTTMSISSPQQFSAFPTILLTAALFRLVLNVASTRLILSDGPERGLDAAGRVIRTFGEFVAGRQDQVFVGAVLFIIVFVIQFVVITKGATRISEVAARFMLDGLPGRQMAIDSDVQAGVISQEAAQARRAEIYRQTDFFAAMDGASKFVRGDAVAGLLIAAVNITGGIFLGVVRHGMSISDSIEVFTKLTIGDGLVSQVPAFLTALAAGLIVTRSTSDTHLGRDVAQQLLGRPSVVLMAAGLLVVLTLTPLPKLPLLVLAGGLGASALVMASRRPADAGEPGQVAPSPRATTGPHSVPRPEASDPTNRLESLLQVDPLELEIGYRLIPMADAESGQGQVLLNRFNEIREEVAGRLGLLVPRVRIRDDLGLGPRDYRIKVRGVPAARGMIDPGRLLATSADQLPHGILRREAADPLTGDPAAWIRREDRSVVEDSGCPVREPIGVLADHFRAVVLRHAHELFGRSQCERLIERVRSDAPALVNDLIPDVLGMSEIQRVLQNLLREEVAIRDPEAILETLLEHGRRTKDVGALTEEVRRRLGRSLVQPYLDPGGRLRAVQLDRGLDARLANLAARGGQGTASTGGVILTLARAVEPLVNDGKPAVVVCSATARPFLREITRAHLPDLVVLSHEELGPGVPVEAVATVVEHELALTHSLSAVGGR